MTMRLFTFQIARESPLLGHTDNLTVRIVAPTELVAEAYMADAIKEPYTLKGKETHDIDAIIYLTEPSPLWSRK